jgi:hypothetical protein
VARKRLEERIQRRVISPSGRAIEEATRKGRIHDSPAAPRTSIPDGDEGGCDDPPARPRRALMNNRKGRRCVGVLSRRSTIDSSRVLVIAAIGSRCTGLGSSRRRSYLLVDSSKSRCATPVLAGALWCRSPSRARDSLSGRPKTVPSERLPRKSKLS